MIELCPNCGHYPCTCGNSITMQPIENYPEAGLSCPVCGEPQYKTPSGDCCKNGHGGAPGVDSSDATKPFGEDTGSDGSHHLPPIEPNNKPAQRILIPLETWNKVLADVKAMLEYRLGEKGHYSLMSSHESYGVIAEELEEMLDAVTSHGPDKGRRVRKELLDIAVAAVVGLGSFDVGGFQW